MKKPKTIYVVQMNLAGLHRTVYTLYWDEELKEYYDRSGNISNDGTNQVKDAIVQLAFKNKKDAQNALKGAKLVADFLITRLK